MTAVIVIVVSVGVFYKDIIEEFLNDFFNKEIKIKPQEKIEVKEKEDLSIVKITEQPKIEKPPVMI